MFSLDPVDFAGIYDAARFLSRCEDLGNVIKSARARRIVNGTTERLIKKIHEVDRQLV